MKCPSCKEELDAFKVVSSGVQKYRMFFDKKKGMIDFDNEDFESDGIVRLIYCWNCDEELDITEDEAIKSLSEKDDLKKLIEDKIKKKK